MAIHDYDGETRLKLEALRALPDPIFVLTESGRYAAIIGGNDRGLYHDGSCLVDFTLYDVLPEAKADWFLGEIRRTLAEDRLRVVEYTLAAADVTGLSGAEGPEGELWFEGRIQPMRYQVDGERAVAWLASNITARHDLEVRLRQLSETDALTGLPNRRLFLARLDEMLCDYDPERSNIALLILDIDRFKTINDRHGHFEGDRVIQTVTRVCGERIKRRDLLARLGGEEFAMLLYDTTPSQALMVAERLCRTVAEQRIRLECGATISTTVSIGVSAATAQRRRAHELLSDADAALYRAKRSGRNRVALSGDETIDQRAPRRLRRAD
ncbi:GGDEF domain-containing protein [Salinisphaera hydrothermalis]|uniref:diguanylate cyclase n=1 Tax=Salinisphaera hydrothermalis (strain C41B8) TaxID=1304275 RepID=A0A084IKR9_SALHC|nr:GGDEF domain-containing protein [Salinisphaera hydrothermalis]KEZ77303.1 diguanylate cyclase [Salinisphaera hydrothermalis C41B8]